MINTIGSQFLQSLHPWTPSWSFSLEINLKITTKIGHSNGIGTNKPIQPRITNIYEPIYNPGPRTEHFHHRTISWFYPHDIKFEETDLLSGTLRGAWVWVGCWCVLLVRQKHLESATVSFGIKCCLLLNDKTRDK